MREQRPAGQPVKHLRQGGAHPLAGACSQYDDVHGIDENLKYKVDDFIMRNHAQKPARKPRIKAPSKPPSPGRTAS
jgi:hypothetical protein